MTATHNDTSQEKINLKNLPLRKLEKWFKEKGEGTYRAKQVFGWLYRKYSADFDEMTNISKSLREQLKEVAVIPSFTKENTQITDDGTGTSKVLFTLEDGKTTESVLIRSQKRNTVCISSQTGCPLDCSFCATGRITQYRNLEVSEILNQLIFIRKNLEEDITNVVFMGMGEPMLNYDNTLNAAHIMNDPQGMGLGARRITISTAGIIPGIYRFKEEGNTFKLAISLNGRNDEIRSRLMPVNKKYPLEKLLKAAEHYANGHYLTVMFQWVMIKGVTDTKEDIAFLKRIAKRIHCKINLIPYNATESEWEGTEEGKIRWFFQQLSNAKVPVTTRQSSGTGINAACGQLSGQAQKNGNEK